MLGGWCVFPTLGRRSLGSVSGGVPRVFGAQVWDTAACSLLPTCVLHQIELRFILGGTREREGLLRPMQVISRFCGDSLASRHSPSSHPAWQDRVPRTFSGQKAHPTGFG